MDVTPVCYASDESCSGWVKETPLLGGTLHKEDTVGKPEHLASNDDSSESFLNAAASYWKAFSECKSAKPMLVFAAIATGEKKIQSTVRSRYLSINIFPNTCNSRKIPIRRVMGVFREFEVWPNSYLQVGGLYAVTCYIVPWYVDNL